MLTSLREAVGRKVGSVPSVAQLAQWQLVAGIILAVQGVAVLLFGVGYDVPVYSLFLTRDSLATKVSGQTVLAPAIQELARLNLAYLVATMMFVTAVIFIISATLWRRQYGQWLKQNWQPLRAINFAITGSLMLITLGLLSGVRDATSLAMLTASVVGASLLLAGFELSQPARRQQDKLPQHLLRTALILAVVVPFAVIAAYLKGMAIEGSTAVPAYLWWLAGTTLVGWFLIALNLCLYHRRQGGWANALFVERWSITLVFLVETAFAWQVFAALLHP